MKNKYLKYILGLVGFLLLVLIVFLIRNAPKERQEIRKKAATPGGNATFSLEPQSSTVSVGEFLPITIKFHTPTTPNDKGIKGIKAILSYSFTGDNPLEITPENIQEKLSSPWAYSYKEVTTEGNTVIIRIIAFYLKETGYTDSTTPKEYATLNFTAKNQGTVNLTFNASESKIFPTDEDYLCEDILSSNLPTGTYTVSSAPTSTPTPTSTPPPGQVKIKFRIKFAGINEQKPDQKVKVQVKSGLMESALAILDNINVSAVNISTDPSKPNWVYQSEVITLPATVSTGYNAYYLVIKGPKHLATRFCQSVNQNRLCSIPKTIMSGLCLGCDGEISEFDFTGYPLPGGDLPLQDGVVNAIDAVTLTNCFETPTNQACLDKADLNLDGVISVADQIIMNNTIYTRWEDE